MRALTYNQEQVQTTLQSNPLLGWLLKKLLLGVGGREIKR